MRFIFRAAMVGLFLASASAAFGGQHGVIEVTNSLKASEIRIARIFRDRLKFSPTVKIRGNNPEDLLLQFNLSANKAEGLPLISYVIDVQIMGRDNNGDAVSQIIGIDSFSNLKPAPDKMGELLGWANSWNSQTLPFRIYIVGDRIVVGQNLLTNKGSPLSENQLLSAFSAIVQYWPVLLKDLRARNILN